MILEYKVLRSCAVMLQNFNFADISSRANSLLSHHLVDFQITLKTVFTN